ncbi:hypothetical protein [Paenibacillus sp. P36]|uniref:hypothetical protein n=1 Tax=Paenibacillus sp. P36 TaxID=3342538 RepID=UPI0038B3F371
MKKTIIILITILLILGLMFFPFVRDITSNNRTLKKFSNHLFDSTLPPMTKEITRNSEVGILVANGDHCDFRAKMTLETSLSKQEIISFYHMAMPSAKGQSQVKINIKFHDENVNNKLVFDIEILDDGYNTGFDLRCV